MAGYAASCALRATCWLTHISEAAHLGLACPGITRGVAEEESWG